MTPLLLIHILGGLLGLVAGAAALIVRKGSPLHRRTGNVFVVAMLVMGASGAVVAYEKLQLLNVLAGTFTFYLVASAWLTVRRKAKETGIAEVALLLVAVACVVVSWTFGAQSATRGGAMGFSVFGTIALLAAAGDVHLLVRRGLAGPQRLARHLWRMCFGLFIAAGSFFLGTAGNGGGFRARLFTPAVRRTHLPQVPVVLVVVAMLYWLWRVRKPAALASTRPG